MNFFRHILGDTKFEFHFQNFFQIFYKGRVWWQNILGNNKGRISHLLLLDPITEGSILLTVKIVALKRGNSETILTVKRAEWRKFIEYSGLSI